MAYDLGINWTSDPAPTWALDPDNGETGVSTNKAAITYSGDRVKEEVIPGLVYNSRYIDNVTVSGFTISGGATYDTIDFDLLGLPEQIYLTIQLNLPLETSKQYTWTLTLNIDHNNITRDDPVNETFYITGKTFITSGTYTPPVYRMNSVWFYMKQIVPSAGNITVKVYEADPLSSEDPDTTTLLATSTPVASNDIDTDWEWVEFNLPNPQISSTGYYGLTLIADDTSGIQVARHVDYDAVWFDRTRATPPWQSPQLMKAMKVVIRGWPDLVYDTPITSSPFENLVATDHGARFLISFAEGPNKPINPDPADTDTGIGLYPTLSWEQG